MTEHIEVVNKLIRRCLAKDEEAWERLHSTYLPVTRNHVIHILKTHNCLGYLDGHLDSIINHIFKELFVYLPKYNFTNFDIWFSRLRISKTFDYLRKEIRQDRKKKVYRDERANVERPQEDEESRFFRQEIRSIVDSLPPRYAIPLKLFYFEGLSYKEIANVMNLQPFAVGMRISRAKRRLRPMLASKIGDDRSND